MNFAKIILAAALAFGSSFGVASAAADVEAPWKKAGKLDLAAVPVVTVTPAPQFDHETRTHADDHISTNSYSLAADEREKTTRIDAAAQRALFDEPQHAGNLSIVRTNNLDYPDNREAANWQRFFQKNGDALPVTASCGTGADMERPVESFAIHHEGDTASFSYRYMLFDRKTCRGEMLRSHDVGLTAVGDGLAFVYRTTCPTCEVGAKERLHVLMPTTQSLLVAGRHRAFTYMTWVTEAVEFSIEPGESAAFHMTVDAAALRVWNRVLDRPLPVVPKSELRIDVVRGASDPLPIVQTWRR